MITQQFRIVCNSPTEWQDPNLPATFHAVGNETRCNASETIEETGTFYAAREFTKRGWYISDDARTYCGLHAQKARERDRARRESARSQDDGA
jgi:hypothetical protein